MLDLDKLSKLRFGMSEVPKIGGQHGAYEEKWSQWYLTYARNLISWEDAEVLDHLGPLEILL